MMHGNQYVFWTTDFAFVTFVSASINGASSLRQYASFLNVQII